MNPRPLSFLRSLAVLALALVGATAARAQYELKSSNHSRLYHSRTVSAVSVTVGGSGYTSAPAVSFSSDAGGTGLVATATVSGGQVTAINVTNFGSGYTKLPTVTFTGGGGSGARAVVRFSSAIPKDVTGGAPAAAASQFAGVANHSGGNRMLNVNPANPATLTLEQQYPRRTGVYVLQRSTFGGTFAAGVPRYLLGEIIAAPSTQIDGVTPAGPTYWRAKPVSYAEVFTHGSGAPATERPLTLSVASIAITNGGSGYTSTPTVNITGGLGSGGVNAVATATLTAGVVTSITITNTGSGYTELPAVTISGGGGSGATATAVAPALPFYYSPHADRVFASQSGRVSITWVTREPVTVGGNQRYQYRSEIFSVSGSTRNPTRTIYWTERSFNGPVINLPSGRVETVNPVFSTNFPETVVEEYQPVGVSSPADPTASAPPELRTFWFQKTAGIGQLRAYNREGRLFMEYLGPLKSGSSDTHEFLGADIIDVVRVAPTVPVIVNLGEQITPRDASGTLLPTELNAEEYLASPVINANLEGQSFYGSVTRADGRQTFFAERENIDPERVVFYWLEKSDAAIRLPGATSPALNVYWPKVKNAYAQIWPDSISAFAHYTVASGGSGPETGIQFFGGQTPQIVFQDHASQTQSVIDLDSQRLKVTFVGDDLNRSLLKFTSANEVWYVRLYTQADGRNGFQQGDGLAAIATSVNVGDRIVAPAGYTASGYIASGTNYLPSAYVNPFTSGVTLADQGAIIPVNAIPGENALKVWWFKKVEPPSAAFEPFYVPAKVGTYAAAFPASASNLVLASNAGTGDLSAAEIAGSVYYQNDRTQPGFNPNEEHAMMIAGRAYALRDDLNNTGANAALYTSQPYVLLQYTALDGRPAMRAFKVLRENGGTVFNYEVTAGTILQAPMPLPLLPLPIDPTDRKVRNAEVTTAPDAPANANAPSVYGKFTFEDRKGYHWVYRGPHATGTPSMGMKFYYTMQEGFYVPGVATQPAVGTIMPYLRPLTSGVPVGDPVTGAALTITYRPVWPATAPELRVAETLTLPKFGLPAVSTQASAEVLYQQSIAAATAKASVTLHDPIREKTFLLNVANGLTRIPATVLTTPYQGKTYFQSLPPHLQSRFYYDPARGTEGSLVLVGKFNDEIAGEDYLDLNVLTAGDKTAMKALVSASDENRGGWNSAIDRLATVVETFVEDPLKAGTYKSDGQPALYEASELATISSSDSAVTSYALTATGAGSGWVTMVFGNGRAFTPTGDPVAMQVFKVTPTLNTGELKVLLSSNPLDEKVSLRHSGDFAARPEDYEFEWRYAPPQDGVAPGIYTYTITSRLGTSWQFASAPAAALPTETEYGSATTAALPRAVAVNPVGFDGGTATPGLVAKSSVDFSVDGAVPSRIYFSADVDDRTGFVVYVNGTPALAYNAPSQFTSVSAGTGLLANADALPRQFALSPNFFRPTANTLEVALYADSDNGVLSNINFKLHAAAEYDLISNTTTPWQSPNGTLANQAVVGGSPTAPLGSPLLVMTDNYFTMRYRAKAGTDNVAGTGWSRWMPPKLVEGWVKRVLAGINPFNQRISDLYNNAVNTDVSLLTQAGKRWEGDISLNLANIDDFGLIEIYETVLNRAKTMSIDSGYNYGPANDALLLAAGYLADLYTILGNEAYADAANPTISIDDSATVTEVNTSRFSFEGQVKSVLEEELALLRGRDDFLAPGVFTSPAYNRLYWNYTRGINSGEALYAVNYNVQEKAGSPTADGVLNAADAQRMFPQAHGDAYGHYLTALKGYQRLLRSPHFTWTPRSEAVTVLGQAVQIDYFDERKFVGAAANLARTAQQVVGLTHRQAYKDDASAGWGHFRDGKYNSATQNNRHWGLDEWTSRAAQGSYYNWIVGNALLPEKDLNPTHTGVQVIDRSTVPELGELATLGADFQTRIDSANAHLNPLGLAPGAIAFDISAADLKAGKSHYEQIYDRALRASLNAKGAFDQAARMTRLLRNQENQVTDYNSAIVDQELAFVRRLIEIYGTPYPAEIGAGKTYEQGYTGPDLHEWFIVDRPSDAINSTAAITLQAKIPTEVRTFSDLGFANITKAYNDPQLFNTRTITIQPNQFVQYSDKWLSGLPMGQRAVTGTLQQALVEADRAYVAFKAGSEKLLSKYASFNDRAILYRDLLSVHAQTLQTEQNAHDEISRLRGIIAAMEAGSRFAETGADTVIKATNAIIEFLPKVVGLANDATSSARGSVLTFNTVVTRGMQVLALGLKAGVSVMQSNANKAQFNADKAVQELGFAYDKAQSAYEYSVMFRDLTAAYAEVADLAIAVQLAGERVRNIVAEGDRIQADRQTFRQRAAAIVQGYRTKDLTFRTFRNESLEQYRSLFDLASRYTYLSAKSYDYETGLLGSTAGQEVISGIVAARSLGDLTGGVPQATVSTLGDAGLAGTMARLQADWSVAEGRLGINNPDTNGTLFSLRRELFRILDGTPGDTAWQQTLEQHVMSDVMADRDVAAYARNLRKADGSAVPGIVIPFSTTIQAGYNFFGLPLAAGDHAFTQSNFATKIYGAGMVMRGYIGMDPFSVGTPNAGAPNTTSPNALAATPYVYLIPVGTDYMLAPPLGDTGAVRSFKVQDQALPLPFNLGATSFSSTQFFNADGTLSEAPWVLRKHQAFRPVNDPAYFYTSMPAEFTSSRLVGRSVWNGGWKIVIPANTLLANEQEGLSRFVASVKDIEVFLRTYSHSGN